jgi:hypothetical protein
MLSTFSIVPESVRLCCAAEYVVVDLLALSGDEVGAAFVETAVLGYPAFHLLWFSSFCRANISASFSAISLCLC